MLFVNNGALVNSFTPFSVLMPASAALGESPYELWSSCRFQLAILVLHDDSSTELKHAIHDCTSDA